MPTFIDLSHRFEDGMPGFKLTNEDGTSTQFTARIRPFFTHEQSAPKFQGKAAFQHKVTKTQIIGVRSQVNG